MADKTVLYFVADPHCGHPLSLFTDKQLQLRNGYHNPGALQKALHAHYAETNGIVAGLRKNARLAIIGMGDIVEGQHHNTKELISPYLIDQKTIAIELINELLETTKYNSDSGDRLYFVNGTPAHAGELEYEIASDLEAVPYSEPFEPDAKDGLYTWPILKKFINGKLFWMAHHGPAAGKPKSRGNAIRQGLRDIRTECVETGQQIPDVVVWADKHDHWHERLEFMDGSTMDGFSLPSWKLKDDYIYKRNPFAFSNIGGLVIMVDGSGAIEYKFHTIHIEQDEPGEL